MEHDKEVIMLADEQDERTDDYLEGHDDGYQDCLRESDILVWTIAIATFVMGLVLGSFI